MEGKANSAFDYNTEAEGSGELSQSVDANAEIDENSARYTDVENVQQSTDQILYNSPSTRPVFPNVTDEITESDVPDSKREINVKHNENLNSNGEVTEDPNKSYGTFQSEEDQPDFFPASATNQFDFLSNTTPQKNKRKPQAKSAEKDNLEEETSADYTDDLTQWKDRTQAAATTSLSLVQVALLRDVINRGEDTYRHYVATVTILVLCIALEIVSGFLIISLYMLKSRAQALTNLDSLQVQKQQNGQDEPDAVAEMEDGIEENFTSSGRIARNIYGLDLACCGCYKPGIEDILRDAIRRKYLQELPPHLEVP